MSKHFTLFLLFLSVGLSAQNITGTQKIPTNALPGTDFIVETTINKGTIKDFMKGPSVFQQMQQVSPEEILMELFSQF